MSAPPFAPRRISFAGCTTDAQAMARLEQFSDELEAENIRAYAASLLEQEPDIDDDEFQDCLLQFRASLAHWREEHRAERLDLFEQMIDAARRHRPRPD